MLRLIRAPFDHRIPGCFLRLLLQSRGNPRSASGGSPYSNESGRDSRTSFKLSLRDLVIMMADRGISVTHTPYHDPAVGAALPARIRRALRGATLGPSVERGGWARPLLRFTDSGSPCTSKWIVPRVASECQTIPLLSSQHTIFSVRTLQLPTCLQGQTSEV
jgi:hypothetical protein